MLETLVSVILKKIILFLFRNIGIVIFVSVILKNIKIIVIPIHLRCCEIPKRYSSNISNYVNIIDITPTQHYTKLA